MQANITIANYRNYYEVNKQFLDFISNVTIISESAVSYQKQLLYQVTDNSSLYSANYIVIYYIDHCFNI